MILDVKLSKAIKTNENFIKGQITAPKSLYAPSKEVKNRTADVLRDFAVSREIMNRPYEEFNNKSLIQMMNECQRLFNNWRDPDSEDPAEDWKSNAVRPIVRNRAISIAAHITGTVVQPVVSAQNEQQDEDKDASIVMGDLMEWANEQSDYIRTFVRAVIGAIINPATIVHTEYAVHQRTVKEVKEDGTWEKKVTVDDILSGFRDTLVPLDEFFIANVYENDVQKQPYLVWRRVIEWSVAQQKYADNQNFIKYVRPGVQVFFDGESDSFYEVSDDELEGRFVEEIIYYNRYLDLELRFVNGVLLDDPDQPMKRKDKLYPFAKGGYEFINDGRFFYYFSLVRKMKDDAEIINTLYRMVIDGTFLQVMPPTAIFGDETITSSVVIPGSSTTMKEGSRMEKIDIGANLNAGFNALEKIEASVSESSNDTLQSGQSIQGQQTAFEISRLEQNARIMLGMFAKMIGFLVKDLGKLRLGDILQFMTIAEVGEIVGDNAPLKYASFLLPGKNEDGKKKSHKIVFDSEAFEEPIPEMGMTMMQGGAKREELSLLTEEERGEFIKRGHDGETKLYLVNPSALRDLKYKIIVRPDMVTPPSDALKKALNLELFDRAIQLPFSNQENLARDFLYGSYDSAKTNADKYIMNPEEIGQGLPSMAQPDVMSKLFGGGSKMTMNAAAEQAPIQP